MDIPVKGKSERVKAKAARTEEVASEQSTPTPVNPWAAARAHYAQVQIILSWSSRVFQRHSPLTKQPPRSDDQVSDDF